MKYYMVLILLMPIWVTSCSWFEEPGTEPIITKLTQKKQPVEVTKTPTPDLRNRIIINEKEVPPIVKAPERKFKFRTPNLINDLPSENDLNKKPSLEQVVDNTIEEATTIRANQ